VQIDKKALEGLLSLNDKQLLTMVNRLLSQSGINPSEFNIDPKDISSIRSAISRASDSELQRIVDQYEANQRTHGGRR
jgi:hypothetical protein